MVKYCENRIALRLFSTFMPLHEPVNGSCKIVLHNLNSGSFTFEWLEYHKKTTYLVAKTFPGVSKRTTTQLENLQLLFFFKRGTYSIDYKEKYNPVLLPVSKDTVS